MTHVIHLHADLMHNVPTEYAPVCLNIKAILTRAVDQNVSLAMIVHVISHVLGINVLTLAPEHVVKMLFAM
jgi:hypothetical protein